MLVLRQNPKFVQKLSKMWAQVRSTETLKRPHDFSIDPVHPLVFSLLLGGLRLPVRVGRQETVKSAVDWANDPTLER